MERSPSAPRSRVLEAAGPHQAKIIISIVATTFLCLLSTLRLLTEAPSPKLSEKAAASDGAERSDQRFSELRRALPEYGAVGYLGDTSESGVADYYLAQYALAPLVVERSKDHELVIGNFPSLPHVPPSGTETDLVLVRDFGNGVLLFAKRGNE